MTDAEKIAQLERQIADAQKPHACGACGATLSYKFNGGDPGWFVTEPGKPERTTELETALRDLREACEQVYATGRIPAEPFVRAGNVLARARR